MSPSKKRATKPRKAAGGDVRFFPDPAAWRRWLEANHATATELWVGFHKKATGRPSITWPEAVDGALCYGWIDGVRYSIDESSYRIRFTPRRPRSIWSAVNLRRMQALIEAGLVAPAGMRAYEARDPARSGLYSFEQRKEAALSPADEARFRANAAAWEYFQARPPGYRRTAIWWVVSAKQEATRQRRLTKLIEDAAAGRPIGVLTRKDDKGSKRK